LVLSWRLCHWEIIMIVYYCLFSTCCIGCSLILIQVYSLVRLDILDFIAVDFCCWMIETQRICFWDQFYNWFFEWNDALPREEKTSLYGPGIFRF
jgi:hypothetical protein